MAHKKNDGTRCGWPDRDCKHHRGERQVRIDPDSDGEWASASGEPIRPARAEASPPERVELSDALAKAFAQHNLMAVAWDYLEEIRRSADYVKYASPAATMMRVIQNLGPDGVLTEEQKAEALVIGGAINGLPPITDEGWRIAERLFEPGMLKYMQRWGPEQGWAGHAPESLETWNGHWASVKGDSGDVLQPLLWRDRGAREEDVALVSYDEDGGGADF